jgi:hypothetical protein
MPDLYNTDLGQNARKTIPSSEFGTPKITPVMVETDGNQLPNGDTAWCPNDSDVGNYAVGSDFRTANSYVFRAVQAIQQYCEVYEVGGSSDSSFLTIKCRDSSIPYDEGTNFQNDGAVITKLQTAVRAALEGSLIGVYIGRVVDDDTDG